MTDYQTHMIPNKEGMTAKKVAYEIAERSNRKDPNFKLFGMLCTLTSDREQSIIMYHADDVQDLLGAYCRNPVIRVSVPDSQDKPFEVKVDKRVPEEVMKEVQLLYS